MTFQSGDIVKVLIPNVINNGYDYRLAASAKVGSVVSVSVLNKVYLGLVLGEGDGNIPAEKIKSVLTVHDASLPEATVLWIKKMSDWTMMPMGAVWKLMSSAADFSKIYNLQFTTYNYRDTGKVVLNDEQRRAAAAIGLDGFGVVLLDGITGSGKTQVYFDAVMKIINPPPLPPSARDGGISNCLPVQDNLDDTPHRHASRVDSPAGGEFAARSGRQVLIMMPEIALTAQFMTRFKDRFGAAPAVWHSNLTPARRRKIWHGVMSGDVKIVVGTRSALFLPWQNLGLIVIDEEHDGSYKQEEMGNYHARDMAVLLAKISDFPVILASATPSFETMRNAEIGKYSSLRLTSRFGGAMLPAIEIVDMRKKNARA